MHDAAVAQPMALERGDHRRMGAAHVQQRRQFEVAGQLELALEKVLLAFMVRRVDVVVQADLADGAELRFAAQTL
ncbi:hypothetical protein D3C77_568430 [compost metagenome]